MHSSRKQSIRKGQRNDQPTSNKSYAMRNSIRKARWFLLPILLASACAPDATNTRDLTAPVSPRFLFDEDWMNGNCNGGVCQPVTSSGGYSSLYAQIQSEVYRLYGLSSKPICQYLGNAMQTMLNRQQYFVRGSLATVNGQPAAGEYYFDPNVDFTPNPPGSTSNARNGAIWFVRGTFQVEEDGHYNNTMDTIRHESAHSLLDLTVDPSGNTLFYDANQGSSMTAQQISMYCQ